MTQPAAANRTMNAQPPGYASVPAGHSSTIAITAVHARICSVRVSMGPVAEPSGLLAQEQLVAVQIFEKHAHTPRTFRRLAMERNAASFQGLVIAETTSGVQRE